MDRLQLERWTGISRNGGPTCAGIRSKIVERLRFLQQTRAHERMLDFTVGERVMFSDDAGKSISGILTRYNKKTVTVLTDSGHQWNVAPSFLRKALTSVEAAVAPNVVPLKRK